MSWFRRQPSSPRDRHTYSRPGYVAVVSAEAQEWEFVPLKLLRQQGDLRLLNWKDSTRWLGQDEAGTLLEELAMLLASGVGSPEERLDIRRATALVEYSVETGTGIAVSPPE